ITIVVFLLQMFSGREWTASEVAELNEKYIAKLQEQVDTVGDPDSKFQQKIDRLETNPVSPEMLGMPKLKSAVQEWLQLETPKVFSGQIWRLITCAFCHDRFSVWHILMNMLFLFWFGPRLESMYGSREFLIFYLTAALAASVGYVCIDLASGDPTPMIGASGAIMAILALFAYHFPTHVIYVMFIIPVEMRWLVLLYALLDLHPLLLGLSGEGFSDGVAHSAHLAGLAFGYFYGRRQWRVYPFVERVEIWWKARRRGFKVVRPSVSAGPSAKSQKLAEEMDAILLKISQQGEASLTNAERKTLEKASRELRNRRS
ncbi:MAG: rhomboid family intramembrane serine protease, partial [Fuerstiella sp.]